MVMVIAKAPVIVADAFNEQGFDTSRHEMVDEKDISHYMESSNPAFYVHTPCDLADSISEKITTWGPGDCRPDDTECPEMEFWEHVAIVDIVEKNARKALLERLELIGSLCKRRLQLRYDDEECKPGHFSEPSF